MSKINIEGHSGLHREEYERIVFPRGNYAAVEIAGDYNVIVINAGSRFDGKFVVSGDYNKITIHNDVNFNNGILIGADADASVGVGNHIKCLGKTFITRDPNQYNDHTNYALQINGHYTHWEGSGMNTKVVMQTVASKIAMACVIGKKASDGASLDDSPTQWCILEKTQFMVLYDGSNHGTSKYLLYVNGDAGSDIACGHLITNNWFGSLGEYDASVNTGQDTTAGGGGVIIDGATTRFVENHVQPLYTGGTNLYLNGRRVITLFNQLAHGSSFGADIHGDNNIFAGNLIYWNDGKSTSTKPINIGSGSDRSVIAGNRGGNTSSITDNSTNSSVGNNELGAL